MSTISSLDFLDYVDYNLKWSEFQIEKKEKRALGQRRRVLALIVALAIQKLYRDTKQS
jgi:hypothetical protein